MNAVDFLSIGTLLFLFLVARQRWEDSFWRKHEIMKWRNIHRNRVIRRAKFILVGAPSIIVKKENQLIAKAERRLFWLRFMAGRENK